MGLLVEDLLALARLERGARSRAQPVELVALARDAVADASATAPGALDHAPRRAARRGARGDPLQLQPGARQPSAQRARAHAAGHAGRGDRRARRRDREDRRSRPRPGRAAGGARATVRALLASRARRGRGPAGAGLGLAIASAIVDAHHGQIAVHDAPGGGALFVVELPVAEAQRAGAPARLASSRVARALSGDSQRRAGRRPGSHSRMRA